MPTTSDDSLFPNGWNCFQVQLYTECHIVWGNVSLLYTECDVVWGNVSFIKYKLGTARDTFRLFAIFIMLPNPCNMIFLIFSIANIAE